MNGIAVRSVSSLGFLGLAALPGCGGSANGSPPPPPPIELDEAIVFLELNATDQDLGIHCFFDGEGWSRMTITEPGAGDAIFDVVNGGSLGDIGSTEVFTESAEPEFSELTPGDFLAMFPEGIYSFAGLTVGGDPLVGDSDLEHAMPDMAVIVTTPAPGSVDETQPLLVEWTLDPNLPGGGAIPSGATIERFQVVVEQEDPAGIEPPLAFSVDLPAGATQFTVPIGFLAAGMDAKVEVLAVGENGNKTAAELGLGTVQ